MMEVGESAHGEQTEGRLRPSVVRQRHRDRDFGLRRALLAGDMLGLTAALAISFLVVGRREAPLLDALWFLLTLPAWAFLFRTYLLYREPVWRFEPSHLDDLFNLFHALVLGTLALWLFYKVVPPPQLVLSEVALFGGLAFVLIATLRIATRVINLRIQGPERVFVVAPIEDVRILDRKFRNHPECGLALVGVVAGEGASEELDLSLSVDIGDLKQLIASGKIDHLLVRLDSENLFLGEAADLKHACHSAGIRFGAYLANRSLLLAGAEINHIEGMGILSYNPAVLSRTSRMLKRGMDIVVAATLLTVFAPLVALIALAIKLDSKGPVFFRQVRVGHEERRFRLIKFRTMIQDADQMTAELMEKSADPNWLFIENDPRVTRLGRFLRQTSLDELPQLWNVLRGDMSLVGPRPLSECDDDSVTGRERHRLDLVPGVTGYWQILGRTSIPFREMVEMDYAYVTSWSLFGDMKILIRTIPAVLLRRGVN